MYLVDTNVISEARKKSKANKGVRAFFNKIVEDKSQVFISVVTIGELRRSVELTVVTRNYKDFVKTGVRVLNPFTEVKV